MQSAGITVSLFIEPDPKQIEASAALKVPYVELHTGAYCEARGADCRRELKRLIEGARHAHDLRLKVNAGHGINLSNITGILEMPHLDTLNIGHSIVSRAVFVGMKQATSEMLAAMSKYRGGRA